MNIEEVKKVVKEFFSDKSRSASATRDGLEDLRDDIESMIECLPRADEEE